MGWAGPDPSAILSLRVRTDNPVIVVYWSLLSTFTLFCPGFPPGPHNVGLQGRLGCTGLESTSFGQRHQYHNGSKCTDAESPSNVVQGSALVVHVESRIPDRIPCTFSGHPRGFPKKPTNLGPTHLPQFSLQPATPRPHLYQHLPTSAPLHHLPYGPRLEIHTSPSIPITPVSTPHIPQTTPPNTPHGHHPPPHPPHPPLHPPTHQIPHPPSRHGAHLDRAPRVRRLPRRRPRRNWRPRLHPHPTTRHDPRAQIHLPL